MRTALIAALLLSGCAYRYPTAIAQSPLGSKETPVAMVRGKSASSMFLFFGPFGDDSLAAAIRDAKTRAEGDTMLNVFVDRTLICIPFFFLRLITLSHTSVYGTMVKYPGKVPEIKDSHPWVTRDPELWSEDEPSPPQKTPTRSYSTDEWLDKDKNRNLVPDDKE